MLIQKTVPLMVSFLPAVLKLRFIIPFAPLLAVLLAISAQATESRLALVVGNSDYLHAGKLKNPRNDAADIAAVLRRLGFKTTLKLDLTQRRFAETLAEFNSSIQSADVALFYYSGHALQFDGQNYIVGTEAQLQGEHSLSTEAISLSSIVKSMESRASLNLIFLDACRNNPLSNDLHAAVRKTGEFAPDRRRKACDFHGSDRSFLVCAILFATRP